MHNLRSKKKYLGNLSENMLVFTDYTCKTKKTSYYLEQICPRLSDKQQRFRRNYVECF